MGRDGTLVGRYWRCPPIQAPPSVVRVSADLVTLGFDAHDPLRLARYWAGVLGWELTDDRTLRPNDDTGFALRFLPTEAPKTGPNQMHFDLTSQSQEEQAQTVARALSLGGRHLDIGQLPTEKHVVLADPEGNEFCVIEPGNGFLAECGFIGALSSDGTQEVGYFWSNALGWPLVWDEDQETAVRAPYGGPKIAWGGPPVAPKTGKNRLHFDLAPPPDGDQGAEAERLVSLGARRLDGGACEADAAAMADPDGNEFCLLATRDR